MRGISEIARCRKTKAQDGVVAPVNFDSNDRFCLDGNRLVLVSGTYGAVGSIYRTELETFSRITAVSSTSASNIAFKVESKDGLISYYGATTDSQMLGVGRSDGLAYSWHLSHVEDRFGNTIDYAYSQDLTRGEFLLRTARWGGNTVTWQQHYAQAKFEYEDRLDAEILWVSGSRMDLVHRLKSITTTTDTAADGSGGSVASVYSLEYRSSETSARSELASVSRCDGSGACLPKTVFSWATPSGTAGWVLVGNSSGPVLMKGAVGSKSYLAPDQVFFADLNGDGKEDMLFNDDGTSSWKAYLSTGNGFSSLIKVPGPANYSKEVQLGDINGDGWVDMVVPKVTGSSATSWKLCRAYRPTTGGFNCTDFTAPTLRVRASIQDLLFLMDLDGDGRADVYAKDTKCLSHSSGFDCSSWSSPAFIESISSAASTEPGTTVKLEKPPEQIQGDFDGDGRHG